MRLSVQPMCRFGFCTPERAVKILLKKFSDYVDGSFLHFQLFCPVFAFIFRVIVPEIFPAFVALC